VVEVRLDVRPDVPLVGRVTEVGRSAARGTGTWQVEVALDPAGAGVPLLSGLTAKVTIPRRIEVAGSVPLEAVVDGDGDSGAVYVIEGGRAHRRPVRIAFLAGDRAALASGVEGVSSVVADGATRVSDGAAVRVSREGE
jgi:multidrug efflux pump subunit AcrA (membrane-fusion protein)